MLLWVNYTNETCRLFLHCRNQKLGRFLATFAAQPIYFVQGGFVFAPTAPYTVHLSKQKYPAIMVSYTVWTVPPSLYSKVRAIFVAWLYILPQEEFVFAPTALYIIHLLKVHCCSVSFGKLCKRNMGIDPLSLYSIFAFLRF